MRSTYPSFQDANRSVLLNAPTMTCIINMLAVNTEPSIAARFTHPALFEHEVFDSRFDLR